MAKLRGSVRKFVRNCDVYGRSTVLRKVEAGFLNLLPITGQKGSGLTIGFIIDLPKSNDYIITIIIMDRLFKDVVQLSTSFIESKKFSEPILGRYCRFLIFNCI